MTVDLLPGEEVHLDATSATTLSSEEYAPGVSEGWSASTPEAIVYTISSSDPAVRFELGTDDPNQPEIIEWQQLSKDGDSTRFQIAWTSIIPGHAESMDDGAGQGRHRLAGQPHH